MTYQESDVARYFNNDTVFNGINREFVSLQNRDIEENNVHLQQVLNRLLPKMKYEDPFFGKAFRRIVYGGSYYKKTRVGLPDEFDLNIVIKLPINYNLMKIEPCFLPGFVKIHSGLTPEELQNNQNINNKTLRRLLHPHMYLNQEMFRRWIESILSRTLSKLPARGDKHILITDSGPYIVKIKKTGPAFTLHIYVYDKVICVDLVPVLELSFNLPNITRDLSNFWSRTWYAVPKPLDNFALSENIQLCWRTCFYEQEKEILRKNGKIKPVLRQMKKLRNTQKWKHIASYYIETLFLHVLEDCQDLEKKSCTSLFMMMLEKLYVSLQKQCIPYYWNTQFNLLGRLSSVEMYNIQGRLKNIIISINKNIKTDPFIIARYILDAEELLILQLEIHTESIENEESLENKDEKSVENKGSQCIIL